MSAGIIIILLLALLLVIFTLQNTVLISVNLLFWRLTEVPLVLALIICLIIGLLIAVLFYSPKIWKLKSRIKEQQKLLDKLQTRPAADPRKEEDEDTEITGDSGKNFFK